MTGTRLCPAARNIIKRIKDGMEDPVMTNRTVWGLHTATYHRKQREYDKQVEYCEVWNCVCDPISFEELTRIATVSE